MKKIGLIGGMSFESTLEYYRFMNELVKEQCGGLNSAKIIMESVNFAEIEKLQTANKWEDLEIIMADIARRLETAGADCIIIGTNTMHKTANAVQDMINIPLINIVDATANEIKKQGIKDVGLLGTKITMEEDFYIGRLKVKHGLNVIVPDPGHRNFVNLVIFKELCQGKINPLSIFQLNSIISGLVVEGAKGIILGCTELPLLIKQKELNKHLRKKIPLFDTTLIHATAAVDFALAD